MSVRFWSSVSRGNWQFLGQNPKILASWSQQNRKKNLEIFQGFSVNSSVFVQAKKERNSLAKLPWILPKKTEWWHFCHFFRTKNLTFSSPFVQICRKKGLAILSDLFNLLNFLFETLRLSLHTYLWLLVVTSIIPSSHLCTFINSKIMVTEFHRIYHGN